MSDNCKKTCREAPLLRSILVSSLPMFYLGKQSNSIATAAWTSTTIIALIGAMYTEFYWLDLHGPDNGQTSTAIRPSQTEILFHRPESCNRYLITLYLLFYRLKIFQMFIKPTRLMKFLIFEFFLHRVKVCLMNAMVIWLIRSSRTLNLLSIYIQSILPG